MSRLSNILENSKYKLLIWDFDQVVYTLDWRYQETSQQFLEKLYQGIYEIDPELIEDRTEFINRLFPYPEINELGRRYGREIQLQVKSLYKYKEMAAADRAIPHQDCIEFIKAHEQLHHAIWSNNYSDTILYLLDKAGITNIDFISSLDKVILSKPDPEGFELIRQHFPHIKKEEMIMIGDSLRSDKVGALNAGIEFFHFQGEESL